MKKKVNEIKIEMTGDELNKERGHLKPTDTVKLVPKTTSTSSSSMSGQMEESENLKPEAVIEPQDQATIKYLSNVKDTTGEISKPFDIGGKNYQMVRGIHPSGEIVLAVFCHDDMDGNGENIIHPMDYFEENIANPMKEQMGMVGQDIQVVEKAKIAKPETDNSIKLGDYKYFLVNEKTGKFRKFKTVSELAKSNMTEEEKFMGLSEMKKFFESKIFGGKNKQNEMLQEALPTGEESDEDMNAKAKKLMALIGKRIPSNIIATIKTPVAQREVIAAFAELIGVPRQGLTGLITGLKDLSKPATQPTAAPQPATGQPATPQPAIGKPAAPQAKESKIITKQGLEESIVSKEVIKVIKVKDLR